MSLVTRVPRIVDLSFFFFLYGNVADKILKVASLRKVRIMQNFYPCDARLRFLPLKPRVPSCLGRFSSPSLLFTMQ